MTNPESVYIKTKTDSFLLPAIFLHSGRAVAGRDTQGTRRSAAVILATGSATLRDICATYTAPITPDVSQGLAYLSNTGLVEGRKRQTKANGRKPIVYTPHADFAEVVAQVPSWEAEYEELVARQQETISSDQLGQLKTVGQEIGGATLHATIDYLLALHRRATE